MNNWSLTLTMQKSNGGNSMSLPERINVMRVVSYDVESIRRDAHNAGMPLDTVDDVLEFIEEWIEEDMTAPLSRHDLIFQDEEGNEL